MLNLRQKCFAKLLNIETFLALSSNNIIKETYGIGAEINISDYIYINSNIVQNIINNEYYNENIIGNIIMPDSQERIVLPDRFYHYCYNLNFRIKTPEIFKSRIIFNYGRHNTVNNDNYSLLYISQDMIFFKYETYTIYYEINFKRFLLDLYFKQNITYDNMKDNIEYGVDYNYRFNSNSGLTIGYFYSYDKPKDNFDDGITIKYLKKDNNYLYFKYNKKISQIDKDLMIKNSINSLKLISDFKIDDNIKVIFSLVTSIDNYKNKSLFFGFGLRF